VRVFVVAAGRGSAEVIRCKCVISMYRTLLWQKFNSVNLPHELNFSVLTPLNFSCSLSASLNEYNFPVFVYHKSRLQT